MLRNHTELSLGGQSVYGRSKTGGPERLTIKTEKREVLTCPGNGNFVGPWIRLLEEAAAQIVA